jgi:hypothetical protein
MDDDLEQEALGIDEDVALATGDFLAPVVAAAPPFSVVLTVWLSMMAALGVDSRPRLTRTRSRSVAAMRSQAPSSRQRRK